MNNKELQQVEAWVAGQGRYKLFDCSRRAVLALPNAEFKLWFTYWTYEQDTQEAYPTLDSLERDTGMARNTIIKARKNLVETGWMLKLTGTAAQRYFKPTNGAWKVEVYRVNDPTKSANVGNGQQVSPVEPTGDRQQVCSKSVVDGAGKEVGGVKFTPPPYSIGEGGAEFEPTETGITPLEGGSAKNEPPKNCTQCSVSVSSSGSGSVLKASKSAPTSKWKESESESRLSPSPPSTDVSLPTAEMLKAKTEEQKTKATATTAAKTKTTVSAPVKDKPVKHNPKYDAPFPSDFNDKSRWSQDARSEWCVNHDRNRPVRVEKWIDLINDTTYLNDMPDVEDPLSPLRPSLKDTPHAPSPPTSLASSKPKPEEPVYGTSRPVEGIHYRLADEIDSGEEQGWVCLRCDLTVGPNSFYYLQHRCISDKPVLPR